MKTAGDLLKEKRLIKELSLQDVATKTKIKIEYLDAIENSNFSALPSSTFAKGFLRNYASFLYLNPDTIVAMFRRTLHQNEKRGDYSPWSLNSTRRETQIFYRWSYFNRGCDPSLLGIFRFTTHHLVELSQTHHSPTSRR
jgi:cytoskeletal protein RodZ